jgi:hypothetical protein
MRFLIRSAIVLIGFPVVALALNTVFLGLALLLNRLIPNPGPAMILFQWTMFVFSMVVVFGGAFYACWLMWPNGGKKTRRTPTSRWAALSRRDLFENDCSVKP